MQAGRVQREKRRAERVTLQLTAHCRLGNRFIRDPIADLSHGGLYLRTREEASLGTPVRVALALPHADGPRFCTLVGSVARVDRDARGRPQGVGVSFQSEETPDQDRQLLRDFVASASASGRR